jgi:ribosomal protein S18 acetylase RimI-like enzyme
LGAQIRRAERADAVVIDFLGRTTFAETFGHLFEKYQEDLRAYLDATFDLAKIERSLRKLENAYWLAVLGRLAIGYAKLKRPSPVPGHAAQPAAQLQKIYLLHAFLGQGIGRSLLDQIIREAAVRAPVLWLAVLRENVHAIGFYKQHGFDAIGEDTYAIGAQSFLFHQMARTVA